MAIGFTPKHTEGYPLNDVTKENFLILAIETAQKAGWDVLYVSKTGLIAHTQNGKFSWKSEVKIIIQDDVAFITSSSTGSEMMDFGKNKKIVSQFIAGLEEQKATLSADELNVKYNALRQYLDTQEQDYLQIPPPTTREEFNNFLSIFIPNKELFVTPVLLDINILIFIIMAITGVGILSPSSQGLISWGANFKPMTLDGQWWRLMTSCFIHIGIIHLVMNMYALLYIGVILEPLLGKARFIAAYLLTGLTASLTSLWWHDITISAGASGAIFGMYGVFLALLLSDLIEKNARKELLTSISVFIGYNLLFGLQSGIDNAAHIGGLLGGVIIGFGFIPSLKQFHNEKLKFASIGALVLLIVASSFAVYKRIPNDIGIYDKQMEVFSSLEAQALEIFDQPQNKPKEELLKEIKEKGINNWVENRRILDEIDKLKLPESFTKRNEKLKVYCDLRIKVYELIYKGISEDTEQYKSELENYNSQINTIIKEFSENSAEK